MAISLTCPECDARMTVPDEAAGKRVRCKKCDAVFRAGPADVGAVENEPPKRRPPKRDDDRPRRPRDEDDKPRSRRKAEDEEEEDERPARKSGKKAKKQKSPLPFILGALGALLLVAGAVVAVAWSQGLFGLKDQIADAEKPSERPYARPPEDYSEHVVLRFIGLKDLGGGRLYPEFEYDSPAQLPAVQLYVLVYRQPRGEYTQPLKLDGNKRLKGTLVIPYVRDPEMTVYVAKKRIKGKDEELFRVSNLIQFPDALGKQ